MGRQFTASHIVLKYVGLEKAIDVRTIEKGYYTLNPTTVCVGVVICK